MDQNLGRHVLDLVRHAAICPPDQITSLHELGYAADMPDEAWIAALGAKGDCIAITRDGNILNAAIRRAAWREASLRMLILDRKWGTLPRRDWPRHLFYWWPHMASRVLEGPLGGAWTVPCRVTEPATGAIRAVTGPGITG